MWLNMEQLNHIGGLCKSRVAKSLVDVVIGWNPGLWGNHNNEMLDVSALISKLQAIQQRKASQGYSFMIWQKLQEKKGFKHKAVLIQVWTVDLKKCKTCRGFDEIINRKVFDLHKNPCIQSRVIFPVMEDYGNASHTKLYFRMDHLIEPSLVMTVFCHRCNDIL